MLCCTHALKLQNFEQWFIKVEENTRNNYESQFLLKDFLLVNEFWKDIAESPGALKVA